ncbi:MAG: hypothetical protein OXT67_11095 [Zetaproteobacteria bacterium]|nr:hypothetical protein [Zetaproteobacteria bacterium]
MVFNKQVQSFFIILTFTLSGYIQPILGKDFPEQHFWLKFFEYYGPSFLTRVSATKTPLSLQDHKKELISHIQASREEYQQILSQHRDSPLTDRIFINLIETDILLEIIATHSAENKKTYLDRFSSYLPDLTKQLQETPTNAKERGEILFYASWMAHRLRNKELAEKFWHLIPKLKKKSLHTYVGCLIAADAFFEGKNYNQAAHFYTCAYEGIHNLEKAWPSSWQVWLEYRLLWNHYRGGNLEQSRTHAHNILQQGRGLLDPATYSHIVNDATDIISEAIIEYDFTHPGYIRQLSYPKENIEHGKWMYLLAHKLYHQGQDELSLFVLTKLGAHYPLHSYRFKYLSLKIKVLQRMKRTSSANQVKEEIATFLSPHGSSSMLQNLTSTELTQLFAIVESLAHQYQQRKSAHFIQSAAGYYLSLIANSNETEKQPIWHLKIAELRTHLRQYKLASAAYQKALQLTHLGDPKHFKALYGTIQSLEKEIRSKSLTNLATHATLATEEEITPLLRYIDQILEMYPQKIETVQALHLGAILLQENKHLTPATKYWLKAVAHAKKPTFRRQAIRHLIQIYAQTQTKQTQLEHIEQFLTQESASSVGHDFIDELGAQLAQLAEKIAEEFYRQGQWVNASQLLHRVTQHQKKIQQRSYLALKALSYMSLSGHWKETLSLGHEIKPLLKQKERANWFLLMAKAAQYILQFKQSLQYYKNFVEEFPHHKQVNRALQQIIFIAPITENHLMAAEHAIILASNLSNHSLEKMAYLLKAGKIYLDQEKYHLAMTALQKSLHIHKSPLVKADILRQLAIVAWKRDDTSNALSYLEKAEKWLQQVRAKIALHNFYDAQAKNIYTKASIYYARAITTTETSGWSTQTWVQRQKEYLKAKKELAKLIKVKDLSWKIKGKSMAAELATRYAKDLEFHQDPILGANLLKKAQLMKQVTQLKKEASQLLAECKAHLREGTHIYPTQFSIALNHQIHLERAHAADFDLKSGFSLPDPIFLDWPYLKEPIPDAHTETKHHLNQENPKP